MPATRPTLPELVQRGAESLAEGAPTSAIRATLTESGIFRYGGPGGVHVGDKVVIEAGGVQVANTITEATLSMTPNDGVTVDFTVGELDDPLTLMRKALIAAHRRIRDLSVSR